MFKTVFTLSLLLVLKAGFAQVPTRQLPRTTNPKAGTDTAVQKGVGFEHRDDAKDSITVSFRFLDSVRSGQLDTSINDFYKYFPLPANAQYLGNNGAAAYPLVFSPTLKPGWDPGFHAFDLYRFTLENTRFFKTTKPFTQSAYQIASGKEQMIKVLHTQSPRPNLNLGFEYRLISTPGFFVTQNTNQNNYRFFSNYQGIRKRYAASLVLLGNTVKNSENGGVQNDSLLWEKDFAKRFTIPVNLGGEVALQPNPFKSSVSTGNIYKEFTFMLRQGYDLGKTDSIAVNDSTTEYLFYPKLRFLHTFTYNSYNFQFKDVVADSILYKNWYNLNLGNKTDTVSYMDRWKVITNDFSLMQFPDTKNPAQFLSVGARLENIKGIFDSSTKSFYNIVLHGEYRNKTRNKLWDVIAKGDFFANGVNSGDYSIYGTLTRFLNKRLGNITLLFHNVNRSPSFIYSSYSSFNFGNRSDYNKENITLIKASADNPVVSLFFANYLATNYLYFRSYYQTEQYGKLINLIQAGASKTFRLSKRWNWYTEVTVQQTDGAAPIKVPLIFTRNRIAYEGVFYGNLKLSTGIEFRYYTPFKQYNYSPLMGQFTPQDTTIASNRPDISAFFHFRIKKFATYLRFENLNALDITYFTFTKNNFAAPHYVYNGLIIRFGILWNFVN